MHLISKEFDFCYGHRVWSQTLNKDFSLDDSLVCRHLHGHQGKIIIEAKSMDLKQGMVTDFKHLNWFKKFVDENIDHKFILDKNDPLFETLLPLVSKDDLMHQKENYSIANIDKITKQEIIEMYKSFIIVDFVPTSENLSKWFFEIIQEKMKKINVSISSVSFFETPKTSSVYKKEDNE